MRGFECNDNKNHLYTGSYNTLSEALRSCSSDKKCVGIVDYHCNNEDEFYHCTDGLRFLASVDDLRDDCIYKKAEYYGKTILW